MLTTCTCSSMPNRLRNCCRQWTNLNADLHINCRSVASINQHDYVHGRRSRGKGAPEFGVADANVNCPHQILSYRYKKERSVALKMRQNPFPAGLCPGPRWGSSRRSSRPPSRLGRGHPSLTPTTRHQPTFGARHASPRIPARSTPVILWVAYV